MAVAQSLVTSNPAIELKGTIAPVTVLCLRSTEIASIERELRARVEPAPQMFQNAPIVIDVADIEDELDALSLPEVIEAVRRCRMIPIGLAHVPVDKIAETGLPILQLGFGRSRGARASSPSPGPAPAPAPREPAPTAAKPQPVREAAPAPRSDFTLTITQPVRGGQVIYAQHGDLVVLAPVNPGAQVIADGHIHVYGRLRGRALAGARGQADARVFCSSLEAELVSVDGAFLTADDIPEALRGRSAQIFVEHGSARVSSL
jgi:septum site-determining protein MinC